LNDRAPRHHPLSQIDGAPNKSGSTGCGAVHLVLHVVGKALALAVSPERGDLQKCVPVHGSSVFAALEAAAIFLAAFHAASASPIS
jgi:hypothetical protein